jgi:hypothetical protein
LFYSADPELPGKEIKEDPAIQTVRLAVVAVVELGLSVAMQQELLEEMEQLVFLAQLQEQIFFMLEAVVALLLLEELEGPEDLVEVVLAQEPLVFAVQMELLILEAVEAVLQGLLALLAATAAPASSLSAMQYDHD